MEISKYKSQLLTSWEQFIAYLRRAQNELVGLGKNVVEKPREAIRVRVDDLRHLLTSAKGQIVKYSSQLLATWEKFTVYPRQAQKALVGLGSKVAEKPSEALRTSVNNLQDDLRDLKTSTHDAMVVAGGKITKCKSQLFARWKSSRYIFGSRRKRSSGSEAMCSKNPGDCRRRFAPKKII